MGRKVYVNVRATLGYLGSILTYMAAAPLFPAAVALYYRESPVPLLAASAAMAVVGVGLRSLHGDDDDIGHREGFLLVTLTWLVVPLLGTIPYLVAGQGTVAEPANALFESMSGFTTTGSTVMGDISFDTHSRAILMWRQFTQWLGGMGILVLMVAILPELAVGGAQVIREEAPGFDLEKLTPGIQQTARALWKVYLGFTVAAALVYYGLNVVGVAPEMTPYNAVAHALTTMPTGGFSPEGRSIEAFAPAVQWAVVPFMVVAGTNFALLWYAFTGEPRRLLGNTEFRRYLLAIGVVGSLAVALLFGGYGLASVPAVDPIPGNLEDSLRQGVFQVVSIVTTTGYASMDFDTWSQPAKTLLLFAMFLGGSVGSAAGSVKIVRWVLVKRAASRELFTTVHPDAISPVRLDDASVDEGTLRSVLVFVLAFLAIFAVSTMLLFLDGVRTGVEMTGIEAMSVAIATLGNVGPGFGVVGPMENFTSFSDPAKLYMVVLMWVGRLEVLVVLVVLSPAYWRR